MSKHTKSHLDRARDELMSHVVRCDVLEASMEDRTAWLEETMDYMADRYPDLSEMQLAQLEMIGKQFIKPVIPHGKEGNAFNRAEPSAVTEDGERVVQAEAGAAAGDDSERPEHAPAAELQPA